MEANNSAIFGLFFKSRILRKMAQPPSHAERPSQEYESENAKRKIANNLKNILSTVSVLSRGSASLAHSS